MRFISCHIENFGKLHDFSYDFQSGVNAICQDNGWGKSTFAAFVRVMLYGFDGEKKRSLEENERKRYSPWQGGVYGGSLRFEIDGKEYEVTRIFKDKDSNDEFELRDVKTNLVSSDYTKELGKEIFKIDRDSFMRTMFIGQSDTDTSQTDDINAKIGNLSDNTNDINNYETANAKMTEILNSLTPRRSTGSLAKRKAKMAELEVQIRTGDTIKDSLERLGDMVAEEQNKMEEYSSQSNEVRADLKKVTALQEVLAKKDEWNRTKGKVSQKKDAFNTAKAYFPNDIPSKDEIKNQISEYANYCRNTELAGSNSISESEKQQYALLKAKFGTGVPNDYELANMTQKVSNHSEEQKKQVERQLARMREAAENSKKSTGISPLIIIGIILAVVGIALLFAVSVLAGIIGVVIGAALIVSGIIFMRKSVKAAAEEEDSIQQAMLAEHTKLDNLAKEIADFFGKYGYATETSRFTEIMYELKGDVAQFAILEKKLQAFDNAEECVFAAEECIKSFLEKYGFSRQADIGIQLEEIRERIDVYNHAEEEIKETENELKALENNVDLGLLDNPDFGKGLPTLEELHTREEEIQNQQETSRDTIVEYNQQLTQLQERYDELEEAKVYLEELKETQDKEQKLFNYISIAQKKLSEAKEAITSKYSKPILDAFNKYHDMIDPSGDVFHVDANMNITVDKEGKQRELLTQSQGCKDLISICLRMALVEAMYTDEKPVLIMDDPFTNLDYDKTAKALDFLEELAKVYQIIYFTCSSARSK